MGNYMLAFQKNLARYLLGWQKDLGSVMHFLELGVWHQLGRITEFGIINIYYRVVQFVDYGFAQRCKRQ